MSGDTVYSLKKSEKLDNFVEYVLKNYKGQKGEQFFKETFSSMSYRRFKESYESGRMASTNIIELAKYLGCDVLELRGKKIPKRRTGSWSHKKKRSNDGYNKLMDDVEQLTLNFNEEPMANKAPQVPSAQELSKKTGELAELWAYALAIKFGL